MVLQRACPKVSSPKVMGKIGEGNAEGEGGDASMTESVCLLLLSQGL
jgi:hypothetical protein